MGKLSIIIPSYNRKDYLAECVHSCVPLAKALAEIVVVDDASSDGTPSLLEDLKTRLAAQEIKLVVACNAENRGAPFCRNQGLELCQGEYVLFLDSDDALEPVGILAALARLRDAKHDFVHGKIQSVDANLHPITGAVVGSPFLRAKGYVAGYHWAIMGAIYRRSFLARVGPWNERLTGSQDWEYQARVKLAAGHYDFLDVIFGYWRHHDRGRIGVRAFSYPYAESVLEACRSVAHYATQAGQWNRDLAWALAKKMFLHALEFSVHGYQPEAVQALIEISRMPALPLLGRLAFSVWRFCPTSANQFLFRAVNRYNRRPQ